MEETNGKNKKFYHEYGRYLEEIKGKTLSGDFWGKNGALFYQDQTMLLFQKYEKSCNDKTKFSIPVELFSMSSSNYYAANGNALSRIGQAGLFSKPLWCWRAWRCLRRAEKLSDKFASLKKMEDMTLGELDGRACILHKARRRNEAAGLLGHGIMKIIAQQMGTKHDLCLFLIHEAEILTEMKRSNDARENYNQALGLLEDETILALTKVRVLKSYGKFLAENKRINEAEDVLGDALNLARKNCLYDQERKIKTIFKTFKLVIR